MLIFRQSRHVPLIAPAVPHLDIPQRITLNSQTRHSFSAADGEEDAEDMVAMFLVVCGLPTPSELKSRFTADELLDNSGTDDMIELMTTLQPPSEESEDSNAMAKLALCLKVIIDKTMVVRQDLTVPQVGTNCTAIALVVASAGIHTGPLSTEAISECVNFGNVLGDAARHRAGINGLLELDDVYCFCSGVLDTQAGVTVTHLQGDLFSFKARNWLISMLDGRRNVWIGEPSLCLGPSSILPSSHYSILPYSHAPILSYSHTSILPYSHTEHFTPILSYYR